MEKLINDIKQLAGRHEGVQVSDPRFLSMLRDVHDFRYNMKLNRLLGLLYKEGTIAAVCDTSKANLRSMISILSDNVQRKHSEFAKTDVTQVLYAFAIAVDIITLEEYRHPVVEKKGEQKQPAKRVSQRKEVVPEQKKPVVIRKKPSLASTNSKAKMQEWKSPWWYILYAFAVFRFTSLLISEQCMVKFGTEWGAMQSFFYISGDLLYFLLITFSPNKWKPATFDCASFSFTKAIPLTLFVKSLIPLAWNVEFSTGGAAIILLFSLLCAATSFFKIKFVKTKYKWLYAFSLFFLIGLTIHAVRPA